MGTIHSINLTSQVWQGITWSHELTIYEPKELTHHDSALLFITGGRTGSKPSDKDHEMAFALTKVTGARVAVLHQVPNQPLLGDKTEDTLIAETFVRYLETKDKNWPLLFPMVKSAVRAMDAVQAWAKRQGQGRGQAVRGDRGLEAGLDHLAHRRGRQPGDRHRPDGHRHAQHGRRKGPNQLEVWGKYSEQIDDYVKRGLMERAQTPDGTQLWKMVDPYTFRDRLTMPKLLINGSNDRYWTLNALDLYWNGLKGPKHLIELPNAGHGLEVNRDWAIKGLGAFFRHTVTGRPMPALSWSSELGGRDLHPDDPGRSPAPSARLWTASSQSRDFREVEVDVIAPGSRHHDHRATCQIPPPGIRRPSPNSNTRSTASLTTSPPRSSSRGSIPGSRPAASGDTQALTPVDFDPPRPGSLAAMFAARSPREIVAVQPRWSDATTPGKPSSPHVGYIREPSR